MFCVPQLEAVNTVSFYEKCDLLFPCCVFYNDHSFIEVHTFDALVQLLKIYRVVDITYGICRGKENWHGSACYGTGHLGANDMRPLRLNSNDELAEVLLLLSTYKEHNHIQESLTWQRGGKMGEGHL